MAKNLTVNIPLEEYARREIERVVRDYVRSDSEDNETLADKLTPLFVEMAEKITPPTFQYPEGVRGIGNGKYPGDIFYSCSTTTETKEV